MIKDDSRASIVKSAKRTPTPDQSVMLLALGRRRRDNHLRGLGLSRLGSLA